jgi:LysR family hydrogen peroxide-inducible transcriptional activator
LVGIIPTLAPFLIPLFIDHIRSDFPGLKLDFRELITEEILFKIQKGELDMGLVSTPVRGRFISTEALFYERFYFYFSRPVPNYHLTTELDLKSLWTLEEGNCFRDQISNFCNLHQKNIDQPFIYRTNSIDALIKIVDGKGGFTILPELSTLTLNGEQEDQVIQLDDVANKVREIGLVKPVHPGKARFIQIVKQYIQQNIPAHMQDASTYEIIDPLVTV